MVEIKQGQRWISESEPELGLGEVVEVDTRQVSVRFEGSEVERRYVRRSAPIRRIRFRVGDTILHRDGQRGVVQEVLEQGGLLFYDCDVALWPETELSALLSQETPEERLRLGQWASPQTFLLRRDAWLAHGAWVASAMRGLMGGRIELLPHQLSIVLEAIRRPQIRLLLADEPGLGKTIEAGLLLHQLLTVGRVERALLIVPETLLHQWFVELLRRFHLVFQILDEGTCRELAQSEPDANPFTTSQQILCSSAWLQENPERRAQLLAAGWDVVLVDEAHHIHEDSEVYTLVKAISEQTIGTLLLTATPEQWGVEGHVARLRLLDPERYQEVDTFLSQSQRFRLLARWLDASSHHPSASKDAGDDECSTLQEEHPVLAISEQEIEETLGALRLEDPALAALLSQVHEGDDRKRYAAREALLDRYGVGRVMFRHTRSMVGGFPCRVVDMIPLSLHEESELSDEVSSSSSLEPLDDLASVLAGDPRVAWLISWLQRHPAEKMVVMTATATEVEALHQAIQQALVVSTALFHERMSLLQRDRQAAWFSEEDGARLLLCSAIGGEGRNFQAAQHLMFFVLPRDPELLIQHIGRLDRIGQRETIYLHIPFVEGSAQALWARWYHEGLDAFAQNFAGGYRALEVFGPRLAALEEDEGREEGWEILFEETRVFREGLQRQLAEGRDRLLALRAEETSEAEDLIALMEAAERSITFQALCLRLFAHLGVDVEPLDASMWLLRPGMRLREDFPWLQGDTMPISFSRTRALQRDTTTWMSMDHPMVIGALELFLGGPEGTASVAWWDGEVMVLEAIFVLECIAPRRLVVERFLPPTPIPIVLDHTGQDVSAQMSDALSEGVIEALEEEAFGDRQPISWPSISREIQRLLEGVGARELQAAEPASMSVLGSLWEKALPTWISTCRERAEEQASKIIQSARGAIESQMTPEIERMEALSHINPAISPEDIKVLYQEKDALLQALDGARLRLDAMMLLLPQAEGGNLS